MKYLVNETCSIELEKDGVFDPDTIIAAMVRAGWVKELSPTIEPYDDNPLMFDGKYITQICNKDELRQFLTVIGIAWEESETFAQLKAKRDTYIKSVKSKRRA